MTDNGKFFGKYRGMVINNVDVLSKGRLLVQVPDVLGLNTSSWAMPCMPMAGPQQGAYLVPTVGSGVWVEFEAGDPDYPIWSGGFWGSATELPAPALAGVPASPNIVLQTAGQNNLIITDMPGIGGITLKARSGPTITVNDMGITISDGKGGMITIAGGVVTINQGALIIK